MHITPVSEEWDHNENANSSESESEGCHYTRELHGVFELFLGVEVVVAVLVVGINGMMIVTMCRHHKRPPSLYDINLATADYCVGLFVPWLTVLGYTDMAYEHCLMVHSLANIFLTTAVLCLTAVTVDRFIYVAFPLWHAGHFHDHGQKRLTIMMCALAWLVGWLLGGQTMLHERERDSNYKPCMCEYITVIPLSYHVYVLFFCIYIPQFLLMLSLHGQIFRMFVLTNRRLPQLVISVEGQSRWKHCCFYVEEVRLLKNLGGISLLFALCYFPRSVLLCETLWNSSVRHPPLVDLISIVLVQLNSFFNPLLYPSDDISPRKILMRLKRKVSKRDSIGSMSEVSTMSLSSIQGLSRVSFKSTGLQIMNIKKLFLNQKDDRRKRRSFVLDCSVDVPACKMNTFPSILFPAATTAEGSDMYAPSISSGSLAVSAWTESESIPSITSSPSSSMSKIRFTIEKQTSPIRKFSSSNVDVAEVKSVSAQKDSLYEPRIKMKKPSILKVRHRKTSKEQPSKSSRKTSGDQTVSRKSSREQASASRKSSIEQAKTSKDEAPVSRKNSKAQAPVSRKTSKEQAPVNTKTSKEQAPVRRKSSKEQASTNRKTSKEKASGSRKSSKKQETDSRKTTGVLPPYSPSIKQEQPMENDSLYRNNEALNGNVEISLGSPPSTTVDGEENVKSQSPPEQMMENDNTHSDEEDVQESVTVNPDPRKLTTVDDETVKKREESISFKTDDRK
jgi:hypothetical protein